MVTKKKLTAQKPTTLKQRLASKFNSRAMAGYTFIFGNLTLLSGSATELSLPHALCATLLLASSACYPLSNKNPKWLYGAGAGVISAQAIIASVAEGAGQATQIVGTVFPATQGALLLRAAYQETHKNKSNFRTDKPYLKPLELVDRYPILSGAVIEAPGTALIATGAFLSNEWALALAASQWTIANGFLGASDPNISKVKNTIVQKTKQFTNFLK